MSEHHESPFEAYLRRIDALLRDLPPAQRTTIQRELRAHLLDAADERGADPNDPLIQQEVIAALGADRVLAAQYGQVHGGVYRIVRRMAFTCGLLGGVLGVLLAPFAAIAIVPPGLALLVLPAFVAAGGLGVWGVLLREHHRPGATWRVAFATIVLLAIGLQVFYHATDSIDLPLGLGLLLAGELLMFNLAITAPALALPRLPRSLAIIVALVLVSCVAPCSYLPNPLGVAYLIAGSYTYRPDQLFINGFATLGTDPVPVVRERLDRLIGQTGLDPLDPVHPLVRYTITEVTLHTFDSPSMVAVNLYYADNSVRSYRVPVVQYGHPPAVSLSSLDDLLAEHRSLGGIAFAGVDAPISLGTPVRLPPEGTAEQFEMTADLFWWRSMPAALVQWAPDGSRFLVSWANADAPDTGGLWLLSLHGAQPRKLAADAQHPAWSADGQQVVFVTLSHEVIAFDLEHGVQRSLGVADDEEVSVFGADAYLMRGKVLWRQPLDGSGVTRMLLPEITAAPTFSPDGQRAAYRCADDLCLADRDGTHFVRLPLGYATSGFAPQVVTQVPGPEPTSLPADSQPTATPLLDGFGLSWSPDGQTLAVSTSSYPQGEKSATAKLWLITRDGHSVRTVAIAPNGLAAPPQWAANGRFVLTNTFPNRGRRVIAVDTMDGTTRDLSQPRWDAFTRVAPDGRELLLWNGRGGFWLTPLLTQRSSSEH